MKYSIKVNGNFVTNVMGNSDTKRQEFVAFVKTFGYPFDEARDCLEVERLDTPITNGIIAFPAQSYMQVSHFTIETHLNNLFATYGVETVIAVFDKTVGIGRAS